MPFGGRTVRTGAYVGLVKVLELLDCQNAALRAIGNLLHRCLRILLMEEEIWKSLLT